MLIFEAWLIKLWIKLSSVKADQTLRWGSRLWHLMLLRRQKRLLRLLRRLLLLLHGWLHHSLTWPRGKHLLLMKVLRLWWGHHVLLRQSRCHAPHVEVVGTGHCGHCWLAGLLMLLLRSRRRSLLWWQLLMLLHVSMWRLLWRIARVAG